MLSISSQHITLFLYMKTCGRSAPLFQISSLIPSSLSGCTRTRARSNSALGIARSTFISEDRRVARNDFRSARTGRKFPPAHPCNPYFSPRSARFTFATGTRVSPAFFLRSRMAIPIVRGSTAPERRKLRAFLRVSRVV